MNFASEKNFPKSYLFIKSMNCPVNSKTLKLRTNPPPFLFQDNCTGFFWSKLFVTRMQVKHKDDNELHPKILVPRVWTNPRNFNFDHIGHAMLALFETLSY